MSQFTPAIASAIGANLAAAVVSVQTHDYSASAIVGWVSVAILAICTMVVTVAPLIANAIVKAGESIIPAIGDFKRRLEEVSKSTYTGQIDELKEMTEQQNKLLADLKEDNARVKRDLAESDADRKERDERHVEREAFLLKRIDDANAKAHEIRNKLGTDILARDVKIQELEEVINNLRLEIARLTKIIEDRTDAQDRKIADNAAGIKALEERAGDAA